MKALVTLFKALSDDTRLRVIKLLEQGELCVCDMVAAFDMIQPKVSFHLGALKAAGLVKDRKDGKWVRYRLDDSDLLKRMMLLSVIERVPAEQAREDRERLSEFLKRKAKPASGKDRCCTEQRSK